MVCARRFKAIRESQALFDPSCASTVSPFDLDHEPAERVATRDLGDHAAHRASGGAAATLRMKSALSADAPRCTYAKRSQSSRVML